MVVAVEIVNEKFFEKNLKKGLHFDAIYNKISKC